MNRVQIAHITLPLQALAGVKTRLAQARFQVERNHPRLRRRARSPGLDGKPVRSLIRRQPEVAALLLPRSTVGYSIMAFVGLERFVRYRQRDEIIEALERTSGLRLSTGAWGSAETWFRVNRMSREISPRQDAAGSTWVFSRFYSD
jgi:hypothetical protein